MDIVANNINEVVSALVVLCAFLALIVGILMLRKSGMDAREASATFVRKDRIEQGVISLLDEVLVERMDGLTRQHATEYSRIMEDLLRQLLPGQVDQAIQQLHSIPEIFRKAIWQKLEEAVKQEFEGSQVYVRHADLPSAIARELEGQDERLKTIPARPRPQELPRVPTPPPPPPEAMRDLPTKEQLLSLPTKEEVARLRQEIEALRGSDELSKLRQAERSNQDLRDGVADMAETLIKAFLQLIEMQKEDTRFKLDPELVQVLYRLGELKRELADSKSKLHEMEQESSKEALVVPQSVAGQDINSVMAALEAMKAEQARRDEALEVPRSEIRMIESQIERFAAEVGIENLEQREAELDIRFQQAAGSLLQMEEDQRELLDRLRIKIPGKLRGIGDLFGTLGTLSSRAAYQAGMGRLKDSRRPKPASLPAPPPVEPEQPTHRGLGEPQAPPDAATMVSADPERVMLGSQATHLPRAEGSAPPVDPDQTGSFPVDATSAHATVSMTTAERDAAVARSQQPAPAPHMAAGSPQTHAATKAQTPEDLERIEKAARALEEGDPFGVFNDGDS